LINKFTQDTGSQGREGQGLAQKASAVIVMLRGSIRFGPTRVPVAPGQGIRASDIILGLIAVELVVIAIAYLVQIFADWIA
jgi:hypothetical protein